MINQRLESRVSKGCRVGVVVVVRAFTCQTFRSGGVELVFLFVKPLRTKKAGWKVGLKQPAYWKSIENR